MAISKVRLKINGTWTNLTVNSDGKWAGSVTAPAATSYNLSGRYYPITIEITNDAGTVKTYEATDATWGNALKLVVKENIKPVITMVSPSAGSYVTNNKSAITFKVTDEASGSGVNLEEVKLKLDSTTYDYDSVGMNYSAITNGYQFTYAPQTALSDGSHTVEISAADNDGNAATVVKASFTVDTVPPALNISAPAAGLITNNPALDVTGTTNDTTSSPVSVGITLNGENQGTVTVGEDGSFIKSLSLEEGTNTIVVTAEDAAGKTSSVTRTVKLDTTVPEIRTLTLAPNPVNASASVTITIEVI